MSRSTGKAGSIGWGSVDLGLGDLLTLARFTLAFVSPRAAARPSESTLFNVVSIFAPVRGRAPVTRGPRLGDGTLAGYLAPRGRGRPHPVARTPAAGDADAGPRRHGTPSRGRGSP